MSMSKPLPLSADFRRSLEFEYCESRLIDLIERLYAVNRADEQTARR